MKTLSVAEVAEILAVSARTVEVWIAQNELPAFNASRDKNSRKPRLRVLERDLETFVRSRAVGELKPAPRPRRPRRKDIPQFV